MPGAYDLLVQLSPEVAAMVLNMEVKTVRWVDNVPYSEMKLPFIIRPPSIFPVEPDHIVEDKK